MLYLTSFLYLHQCNQRYHDYDNNIVVAFHRQPLGDDMSLCVSVAHSVV